MSFSSLTPFIGFYVTCARAEENVYVLFTHRKPVVIKDAKPFTCPQLQQLFAKGLCQRGYKMFCHFTVTLSSQTVECSNRRCIHSELDFRCKSILYNTTLSRITYFGSIFHFVWCWLCLIVSKSLPWVLDGTQCTNW